ncbi:hypothetical protein Bcell_1915 [Evansella cellulosilytica DSM 2522]|uniref:YpoC-like domain-containing protein n=1 Tax=Evansella cellulosilytica (strain ATCC 21833 / DSM 2522 / FERM P-1141 / JCM 9156 / N-4) TaxID=649639 RepID=E6TZK3_EVAC2|nr:hypothetical protein Bcell_1915 [Evansella cellulosilytica DSM 2522]
MLVNKKLWKVPEAFVLSPFYGKGAEITISNDVDFVQGDLFHYDIRLALNCANNTEQPWDNLQTLILKVKNLWLNEGLPTLTQCFHERNRNKARPYMLYYLSLYIQTMIWLQERPVYTLNAIQEQLNHLPYAPMNIRERISFILNSPDHYHSFITLKQLFEESHKKWTIYLMKKN